MNLNSPETNILQLAVIIWLAVYALAVLFIMKKARQSRRFVLYALLLLALILAVPIALFLILYAGPGC